MDSVEQFIEEQCVVDVKAPPVSAVQMCADYLAYLEQLRVVHNGGLNEFPVNLTDSPRLV